MSFMPPPTPDASSPSIYAERTGIVFEFVSMPPGDHLAGGNGETVLALYYALGAHRGASEPDALEVVRMTMTYGCALAKKGAIARSDLTRPEVVAWLMQMTVWTHVNEVPLLGAIYPAREFFAIGTRNLALHLRIVMRSGVTPVYWLLQQIEPGSGHVTARKLMAESEDVLRQMAADLDRMPMFLSQPNIPDTIPPDPALHPEAYLTASTESAERAEMVSAQPAPDGMAGLSALDDDERARLLALAERLSRSRFHPEVGHTEGEPS